jgi:hypothetical protein
VEGAQPKITVIKHLLIIGIWYQPVQVGLIEEQLPQLSTPGQGTRTRGSTPAASRSRMVQGDMLK